MVVISIIFDTHSTQLVTSSDGTYPNTFATAIKSKIYNRATGTLSVSLDASTNIWQAARPIGNEPPEFISLKTTGIVDLLADVTYTGNGLPYYGYCTRSAKRIYGLRYDGSGEGFTLAIIQNATPGDTGNILSLAGMLQNPTQGFIFASVTPTPDITFGNLGSGIAVIALNDPTPDVTKSKIQLAQTAADSTYAGAKALALDPSTDALKVIPTGNTITISAAPEPDLYWDNYLKRLYVGLQVNCTLGNGCKSIVVGQVSTNGVLTWASIVNDSALTGLAGDPIIARTTTGTVSAYFNRVMHCSTGPCYLIVQGASNTTTFNTIYAFPLVDDPDTQTFQGTIADKTAPLSNGKFVTPATINTQMTVSTDIQAQVGAGPLPTNATTDTIADMEVIGDTVYVSIASAESTTINNGIFYSQAQFDKTGKIASWTPWTKRAFPANAFYPYIALNGGVGYFAVDAVW